MSKKKLKVLYRVSYDTHTMETKIIAHSYGNFGWFETAEAAKQNRLQGYRNEMNDMMDEFAELNNNYNKVKAIQI